MSTCYHGNEHDVMPERSDENSFDEVFRRVRNPAINEARRILKDRELAEDMVQEASLGAWQKSNQLRDHRKAQSWFRTIIVRRCYSYFRKKREDPLPPDDATFEAEDKQQDPSCRMIKREGRNRVARILAYLPNKLARRIVRLHVYGKLRYGKISVSLGWSNQKKQGEREVRHIFDTSKETLLLVYRFDLLVEEWRHYGVACLNDILHDQGFLPNCYFRSRELHRAILIHLFNRAAIQVFQIHGRQFEHGDMERLKKALIAAIQAEGKAWVKEQAKNPLLDLLPELSGQLSKIELNVLTLVAIEKFDYLDEIASLLDLDIEKVAIAASNARAKVESIHDQRYQQSQRELLRHFDELDGVLLVV